MRKKTIFKTEIYVNSMKNKDKSKICTDFLKFVFFSCSQFLGNLVHIKILLNLLKSHKNFLYIEI